MEIYVSIFGIGLFVLYIASIWKIYEKADRPGWAAIIPIYNIIVLLEIVGKPVWWIVFYFIPFVNVVISIIVYIELAKSFDKGAGFGIGLVFLPIIFFPILGFGDAAYIYGEDDLDEIGGEEL